MSAAEVIEQIKALPPEEKAQVLDFVLTIERKRPEKLDSQTRDAAVERIFNRYDELFKKLAQ